jgi:hypothetical protein
MAMVSPVNLKVAERRSRPEVRRKSKSSAVSELDKITTLCTRLGAPSSQAATMASQLLKRADQISRERGVPREQALAQLLQILWKAGVTCRRASPPGHCQRAALAPK